MALAGHQRGVGRQHVGRVGQILADEPDPDVLFQDALRRRAAVAGLVRQISMFEHLQAVRPGRAAQPRVGHERDQPRGHPLPIDQVEDGQLEFGPGLRRRQPVGQRVHRERRAAFGRRDPARTGKEEQDDQRQGTPQRAEAIGADHPDLLPASASRPNANGLPGYRSRPYILLLRQPG